MVRCSAMRFTEGSDAVITLLRNIRNLAASNTAADVNETPTMSRSGTERGLQDVETLLLMSPPQSFCLFCVFVHIVL